jgi:hypothetical protein
MFTMRGLTVVIGLVALTAACNLSSSPTSSSGPAASRTVAVPAATQPPATPTEPSGKGAGAASAVAAVQALLPNPPFLTGAASTPCVPRQQGSGPFYSGAAGCPVTQRLEQRLQTNPGSGTGGGANPICRCQNPNPSSPITLISQAGATATVQVAFGLPGQSNNVGFSVLSTGGRWYVDDTFCLSGGQPVPATSIYQPFKACFA